MDSTGDGGLKVWGLRGGKTVRTETSCGLDKREVSRIVFFWPRYSSIPSVKLRGKRVGILLSTSFELFERKHVEFKCSKGMGSFFFFFFFFNSSFADFCGEGVFRFFSFVVFGEELEQAFDSSTGNLFGCTIGGKFWD